MDRTGVKKKLLFMGTSVCRPPDNVTEKKKRKACGAEEFGLMASSNVAEL